MFGRGDRFKDLIFIRGWGINGHNREASMLLTCICLIFSFLIAFPSGTAVFASSQPAEECGGAVVKATGRGMPRTTCRSEAQARLLAKRAATVKAYRNLLRRVGESSSSVEGGTGSRAVNGFIKGAYIDEVRYYPDGKVEVVVGLNVTTKGGMELQSEGAAEAALEGEYVSERPGTVISEKEWKSLQVETQ